MTRSKGLRAGVLCLALVALFALPASAQAAAWTCEASGVRVELGGSTLLEPVTANRGARECALVTASTPKIDQGTSGLLDPLLPTVRVTADAVYARTNLAGRGGLVANQRPAAAAGAASVRVEVKSGGDTVLDLVIEGLTTRAAASCVNGSPSITSASDAVVVRLNGQELRLDSALEQIAGLLSQLGLDPLLKIEIAKTIAGDDALTIRALEVQLLGAPQPLARLVVGESKVAADGDVCAIPRCPAGTIEVDGQCVLVISPPCPEGSAENSLGQCVVPPNPDGTCPEGALPNDRGECVLVVTPPCPPGSVDSGKGYCVLPTDSDLPTGGRIVPPDQVPSNAGRRCTRGRFGNLVAILGTNGADRITGTNRSDRIFALGGRNRVSGGRGNDCLEGGSGSDQLDGSNGADLLSGGSGRDILNGGAGPDRLYGDSGADRLIGGSGNDRMWGGNGNDRLAGGLGNDRIWGGAGRDYIEGGNGSDRLYGGSGNDVINAATAGGTDVVDCGPGRDVVRINPGDRVRNCERVLIVRRPAR